MLLEGKKQAAAKGKRWMPWRSVPKKDVAGDERSRGAASERRSGNNRMGKPTGGHASVPRTEYIGASEGTGGTETSKYPEEEKSNEIP